jgi:hypothetical protein
MSIADLWPFFFEVGILQVKACRERTVFVSIEEDGLMRWLDHSGRFGHPGFGVRWLQRWNRHGHLAFEDVSSPDFDPAKYHSFICVSGCAAVLRVSRDSSSRRSGDAVVFTFFQEI